MVASMVPNGDSGLEASLAIAYNSLSINGYEYIKSLEEVEKVSTRSYAYRG